jgi:hypothetical protein
LTRPARLDEAGAPAQPAVPALQSPQRAAARFRFGDRLVAESEVEVTPAGLLAIGGMVAAILLGSAVIVRAARHRSANRP